MPRSVRLRALRGRKDDSERAALPLIALQLDMATLHLHRPAGDAEPEPCSAGFARARLIDAIEAVEDRLAVFRGDPGAGVDHLDHRYPGAIADDDADVGTLGAVLDGVVEKVDEGL